MPRGERGIVLVAALLAVCAAPLAAKAPLALIAVLLSGSLVLAVVIHPPAAAYALLGITPLTAGIDRGAAVIPVLRPSEVVAVLVALGLLLRPKSRPRFEPRSLELPMILLALTSSVVPLLWMLVRGQHPESDDLLYGLQLWKYFAIFLIVKASVRTEKEISTALMISMIAASVVGVIGVLQSLLLFGIPDFLAANYALEEGLDFASDARGTSTLSSSLAVGDVMAVSLVLSLTWLVQGSRHRKLLIALCVAFVFGVIGAGQFSGYIAFLVAIVVVGLLTRRLGRYVAAMVPVVLVAAAALWPVISKRLSGFDSESGLPQSWVGRLENLEVFFWPPLGNYNWIMGVRPAGRVPAPETWREFVYIESGWTWLLWSGGVLFLAAFLYFMWQAMRVGLAAAQQGTGGVRIAGVGATAALAIIGVLMMFDPHLTLRGMADLTFSLLALCVVGLGLHGHRTGVQTQSQSLAGGSPPHD